MSGENFRTILLQMPCLVTIRDLNNSTIFGNAVLAKYAGVKCTSCLEGMPDYSAPWRAYAGMYKRQSKYKEAKFQN